MSSLAPAASHPSAAAPTAARTARLALPSALLGGTAVAVALAAVAFVAGGGQTLSSASWTEVALLAAGGALGAAALLTRGAAAHVYGGVSLWLFALFAGWTAVSVSWAISGEAAWVEASRTLAYLAVFGGGLCLARVAPRSGAAVLGGIGAAAVAVAGYALLTKVFPGHLAADQIYARLRAPFGYWNAIALMAALGVPAMLWFGARREGRPALAALAYPATALLLLTVLLASSRGSLLALGIGLVLWFACVPLRLRAAVVLLVSAAGAGVVAAWAFSQSALTDDGVDLGERVTAGHHLGLWILALVVALAAAGLLASFALAHGPVRPALRRQVGIGLVALVVLAIAGGLVALGTRSGGLDGQISRGWHQVTDVNATIPTNQPSRLTAAGSVRARYWSEAIDVWKEHRVRGSGAGAYGDARRRFSRDKLRVEHAHGYVVQTMADLGLVGLALSLLVLVAWGRAALRAAPLRARPGVAPRERAVTLTLLATVLVFGVHSLVDWTWFVPAVAVTGLLAAGWLAGRGPLAGPAAEHPRLVRDPLRLAGVFTLAAAVVLGGWAVLGPQRSSVATDRALSELAAGHEGAARAAVADARAKDPRATDPLYALSAIEDAAGHPIAARDALRRAVRLAPATPEPWLRLATYELETIGRPADALADYQATLALDPNSKAAVSGFLEARALTTP